MSKIRIGIVGYGNIGRGVEIALANAPDMELAGVFSRRDPKIIALLNKDVPIYSISDAEKVTDKFDVLILCGGSATDLVEQGPYFAALYNTVDSYDNHVKIPEHLAQINAKAVNTTAVISTGWDPGLFSTMKLLTESILPDGAGYAFWGKGVSQGHSDALRRVEGVRNAVQYTIPIDSALDAVRSGSCPNLNPRDKHLRECYVVAEPNADLSDIEITIKNMPNYFADYDTVVNFISEEQLREGHSKMPHGGFVLHSGKTGKGESSNSHVVEFSLKLESNPEFTASVMVAYARACYRLSEENSFGAKTVFDIPLSYLSPKSREKLIQELL